MMSYHFFFMAQNQIFVMRRLHFDFFSLQHTRGIHWKPLFSILLHIDICFVFFETMLRRLYPLLYNKMYFLSSFNVCILPNHTFFPCKFWFYSYRTHHVDQNEKYCQTVYTSWFIREKKLIEEARKKMWTFSSRVDEHW